MTAGKAVAVAAFAGAGIIALAEAPDWQLEPFAAWLAVMTGTAFMAQLNEPIGKTMAVFLLTVIVVRKGPDAFGKLSGKWA